MTGSAFTFTLLDYIDDLLPLDLSDAFLASDRDGPIRLATVAVGSKGGPESTSRVTLLDLAAGIDGPLNGVTFALNLSPADSPLSIIDQPVITARRSPAMSGGAPLEFGVAEEQVIGQAGNRVVFTLAEEQEADRDLTEKLNRLIVDTHWNEVDEQAEEFGLIPPTAARRGFRECDADGIGMSAQIMLDSWRSPKGRIPPPLIRHLAGKYGIICASTETPTPMSLALLAAEVFDIGGFGRQGAPKHYAKLMKARALLRKNPGMSQRQLASAIPADRKTIKSWLDDGLLPPLAVQK